MFKILWMFLVITQTVICTDKLVIPLVLNVTSDRTTCEAMTENILLKENQVVELNVSSLHHINFESCNVTDKNYHGIIELTNKTYGQRKGFYTFSYTINAIKAMSGNWTCKFYTLINVKNILLKERILNNSYTTTVCNLSVTVQEPTFCQNNPCLYIAVGVTFLVVIIFAGQTICVIYFRRKANAIHRFKSLSSRPRDKNDKVRYSATPKKKPLIQQESTSRESIIYEALDSIQSQVPPEPPALETLPRLPKPSKNSPTDTASSSGSDIDTLKKKKVTKKFSLPSLEGKPQSDVQTSRSFSVGKPKVKPKPSEKRTTLDRIKERPPLPLPLRQSPEPQEEYEEMAPTPRTPEPVKNRFQKSPPPKPNVPPQKTMKPVLPPPVQNKLKKPVMPPKSETVNELENLLKNKKLNPASLPRPSKSTTKPAIPQPPNVQTKPTKPTTNVVKIPKNPPHFLQPTPVASPPKTSTPSPIDAPAPPPIATLPRARQFEEPKPAAVAPKPYRSLPMGAPIPPPTSTLPKAAPPTPHEDVEENVYQEDIYHTNSSDEEWTYEPLQKYNIYSM